MSPAETLSSVVPMTVRRVPVTTGGKKRSSLAKKGAARKVARPATIIEPYMAARPSVPPAPGEAARPMAMSGETAVKVTPWMRGSRTPILGPSPADWMMVAMPQVNRSALMRWIVVASSRPSLWEMTRGTITAPA